jgi:hypothetical protein
MNSRLKVFTIILFLACLGNVAEAQNLAAYDLQVSDAGASYAGNANFNGSIGMDFDVNSPNVQVTTLGVFDANRDGFHHVMTTYLWNRDTQALLASQTFTPADPGTLDGYHRFKAITPLTLNAGGHYTISSFGFMNDGAGNDRYGEELDAGFVRDRFSSFGGYLTAVGVGRYSEAYLGAGVYPYSQLPGTTSLWANSSSFQFIVPEPGVGSLLMCSGFVGSLVLMKRRRKPGAKAVKAS